VPFFFDGFTTGLVVVTTMAGSSIASGFDCGLVGVCADTDAGTERNAAATAAATAGHALRWDMYASLYWTRLPDVIISDQ
jgi:hypothetical protein